MAQNHVVRVRGTEESEQEGFVRMLPRTGGGCCKGGAFSGGVSTDITVLVGYIQSQPFFFFLNILVSFPCLSHHLDMEAF